MPIIVKSQVFFCFHNRATNHNVYHSPPQTQVKKPMKHEAESPFEKELVQPAPAFRSISRLTSEECDDILSLKRANPVCDSDEEDFRSVKRQWREERDDEEESSVPREVMLHWSNRVAEDKEQGYLLSFIQNIESTSFCLLFLKQTKSQAPSRRARKNRWVPSNLICDMHDHEMDTGIHIRFNDRIELDCLEQIFTRDA
jgi:hypothetical protein